MLFTSSMILTALASILSVQAAPALPSVLSIEAALAEALLTLQTPTVPKPPPVPLVSNAPEIASELLTAPSTADRLTKLLTDSSGKLLSGDALRQLTVFDFNQQTAVPGGKGGSILLATIDNFPMLTGLDISAAVSFVEPCGLNIPHTHNRADEFFTVIDGVLDTGFVQENAFNTQIQTQLGKYQGTVFPMGSIHYQQNPTCKPAVFVAALNSADPGRSDIATSFWMLPSDVVDAALGFPTTIGGSNIDAWRSHLPVNLAAGVDSCLRKCGLSK